MDSSNNGIINATNSSPTTDSAATGSAVTLRSLEKPSTLLIQVSGTYTGALTLQSRSDADQPWVSTTGTLIQNAATGVYSATIASAAQGVFKADITGLKDVRLTALAAFTGNAKVTLRATSANGISSTSGTVSTAIPAATTSIAKAEDAVAATGDTGVFMLGVRRDAPIISASATGDYNEIAVGSHGQVYVQTIDAAKRTYAAAMKFTPIAGTVFEIAGAASTTVEINRLTFTLNGTAAGKIDFFVAKRSAAATGGTAVAATKVPYNAADAASAATVRHFTAAPTAGAIVGNVRAGMLSSGANVPSDRIKIESGTYSKSFMLTAAAQAITLELAGTLPAGAELAIDIEWTEY